MNPTIEKYLYENSVHIDLDEVDIPNIITNYGNFITIYPLHKLIHICAIIIQLLQFEDTIEQ